jgi:uncharacterized protein YndB with AHSA1/START domain
MNEGIDASGFTLELRTTLEAPPAKVFELLSDPNQIRRWFGPHGYTATAVDVDLRLGGAYRISMRPPQGEEFHIRGAYREIAPAGRIAFTFEYEEPGPEDVETLVTLTLRKATAGTTELALEQTGFATEDRRELHRDGWRDSFERLVALLSDRPSGQA